MSNITWDFNGKVVLVVGDSRGIGYGVSNKFKESGASLYGISSLNCDISVKEDIDEYFDELESVDILVNVAGINYTKKIEEIDIDEWDKVLDTNLRSFFYITKKVLEIMPDGGKIVNVSSIAGRNRSVVSGVHYTSSKAGIIGLTKQVAYEVGKRNINVNVVCPSQTRTDMLSESMTEKEIHELGKSIPLGRIAKIEEVVDSILFLCSDEASYITGTALDVNGGQL
jgi:NAD(P)-dependent dehydrogenase (short-subunit alcohol dehydrogenase family)